MLDEKWILYENEWLGGWPEKKLQNTYHRQTCTNKRSWSLLVLYCPSAPLQPSESRQNHYIWEIYSTNLSKMLIHKNCNACSQHWSKERSQFSMTKANHTFAHLFKSWINLAISFGLLCHIHLACYQSTTTYFKHLNNFFQGKCFHKEQEAEDVFQEFIKFGITDFHATGINKLISHWQKEQKCWLQWFLFWLINMCLGLVIMI